MQILLTLLIAYIIMKIHCSNATKDLFKTSVFSYIAHIILMVEDILKEGLGQVWFGSILCEIQSSQVDEWTIRNRQHGGLPKQYIVFHSITDSNTFNNNAGQNIHNQLNQTLHEACQNIHNQLNQTLHEACQNIHNQLNQTLHEACQNIHKQLNQTLHEACQNIHKQLNQTLHEACQNIHNQLNQTLNEACQNIHKQLNKR